MLIVLVCVATVTIGVTRVRARVSLVRCARRGRRGDSLHCQTVLNGKLQELDAVIDALRAELSLLVSARERREKKRVATTTTTAVAIAVSVHDIFRTRE